MISYKEFISEAFTPDLKPYFEIRELNKIFSLLSVFEDKLNLKNCKFQQIDDPDFVRSVNFMKVNKSSPIILINGEDEIYGAIPVLFNDNPLSIEQKWIFFVLDKNLKTVHITSTLNDDIIEYYKPILKDLNFELKTKALPKTAFIKQFKEKMKEAKSVYACIKPIRMFHN